MQIKYEGEFPYVEPFPSGKHCYVVPFEDKLLKIFNFFDSESWTVVPYWGDPPGPGEPNRSVSLEDACLIQNICWLHGLAPRAYGIWRVKVGALRLWGQLVEEAKGDNTIREAEAVYKKVIELGKTYGFGNDKFDVSEFDVVGKKLVDFNTFHFKERHLVKAQYEKLAKYGNVYYHNIPELGLNGSPRKNEKRIGWLGLDRAELKGKTLVDLGCAGGYFVRYARDKGAAATGYDMKDKGSPDPVKAAYLASFMLGYHDVEFKGLDLSVAEPQDADIALFLSMNFHIGIPEWLAKYPFVIFEDNSNGRNADQQLKGMFKKVERVGTAADHGDKPIYWCSQ